MDLTLHHCASTVVLDVALPSGFLHEAFLIESLLLKEVNGQIVSVCQEVLKSLLLCMSFESVHQSSSKTLNLLRSRDCKEDDLSESLRYKWPEDTASYDLRSLAILLFHNDHRFVLAVHDKLNNIRSGHFWQLFSNDILEINKVPHALQRSSLLLGCPMA